MAIYEKASDYLGEATTLQDRITRINNIIDALELKAVDATESQYIEEYSLNDGQTQIRTRYRGIKGITDAINAFETIRQRYINQLQGRGTRLVDGQNFI